MIWAKRSNSRKAATKWLVRLQSPTLTPEEEAKFFDWLALSPRHQAAYLEAEQLWERGAVLDQVKPKEDTQKATQAGPGWLGIKWGISRWQYVSLASIVCIALSFWLYQLTPTPKIERYKTGIGQQQKIALADGSELFLNTDSELRVDYSPQKRVIFLDRGEVFFDIENMPNRPFDVITGAGVVRVLGTQFSVYDSDSQTVVTVLEGKVGVDGDKQNIFNAEVTLIANQQISIGYLAELPKPVTVDAKTKMSWRAQHLVFRGEPLHQVIKELNRYFDKKIVLGDSTIADRKVVAVIQISKLETTILTLEESLQLVAKDSQDDKSILLYPRKK